jgi:hypothetical protein
MLHILTKSTFCGIVFQQVRQKGGGCKVVDRHHVDAGHILILAVRQTADAAETINTNFERSSHFTL